MKISATLHSQYQEHVVTVNTNGASRQIDIAPKANGYGSSVNGGELLLLALATCFCNDLYREAARMNVEVKGVDVHVTGEFDDVGCPGKNFRYSVNVASDAPPDVLRELVAHTDRVAEVHNTLRKGIEVTLQH